MKAGLLVNLWRPSCRFTSLGWKQLGDRKTATSFIEETSGLFHTSANAQSFDCVQAACRDEDYLAAAPGCELDILRM